MTLSAHAQDVYAQITTPTTKLGDLKKLAKPIKKDHDLAMELWSTGQFHPRMLAVLIMDKKRLTQEAIDQLVTDLQDHGSDERNRITEWLMANQLMKSKKTTALLTSWQHHPSPTLRRLFWYHQGRLRWTGQTPPDNTPDLLASLTRDLATAEPEVQWAMNFTAGWIAIYDPSYRDQCIALGETVGLYRDEKVARGCTPNYLPEFIRIQAAKVEAP